MSRTLTAGTRKAFDQAYKYATRNRIDEPEDLQDDTPIEDDDFYPEEYNEN